MWQVSRYKPGTWDHFSTLSIEDLVYQINVLTLFGDTATRDKAIATLAFKVAR